MSTLRQPKANNTHADHGLRVVSTCVDFIEKELMEGTSITNAMNECSQLYSIAKSNLWRWWKVYSNYGEIHIILNEQIKKLRRRYGCARRKISDRHFNELQLLVDSHPEYYLDEYVSSLARKTGIFYHPSTISRTIRYRMGYTLQV